MWFTVDGTGNVKWNITRKSYKKTRWRKVGYRLVKRFRYYYGIIVVR